MASNIRRPSQAETSIPVETSDEPSGVYGELPDRLEQRIRNANATLNGIRVDFTEHAKTDEKSFSEVKGSVVRLEGVVTTLTSQHASALGEIGGLKGAVGEVSGKVSTLLQLQQAQTTAQLELVANARSERSEGRELALAKTEASKTIWLKLIAALIVIAGIIASAMVGHAVK